MIGNSQSSRAHQTIQADSPKGHSHYHDLAWFALLLAAAPCGAAISVDSTLAAWREAACGRIPHVPVRSRAIGLPLRLASLVLGIIYFFPGIWKFWFAGIRWAIGDNLKFTMYQKWVSIEGWTPAIRIDQYPWAYQLGGVLTVLFEIAFVFLVLFRNGRVLAAVAGVCFHSSTRMFLLIASYIPYYYVCLFDWDSVFARAGRAIGLRPIRCTIRTGNTRLLQLLAVAKSVDLFGCLNLETAPSTTVESLRVCDQRTGELIATGTTGLRAALTCVLVLWPMAFAMRTRLVRDFVKEYLLAANVNYTKAPSSTSLSNVDAPISKSLVVVAIFLLVGNSFFGFLCIEKAWPLCCYPTFRGLASKTRAAVAVMVEYPDGTNRQIDRTELRSALGMTRVRFDQMMKGILTDPSRTVRAGKLEELWEKAILTRSDLEKRSTVHFYTETLSVVPAEWKTNPISRTEIHKYEIRP